MATVEVTLERQALLQMLISACAISTNEALFCTCHVKKYSLKINDFIPIMAARKAQTLC